MIQSKLIPELFDWGQLLGRVQFGSDMTWHWWCSIDKYLWIYVLDHKGGGEDIKPMEHNLKKYLKNID